MNGLFPTFDELLAIAANKPPITEERIGQIGADMANPFAKMGGLLGMASRSPWGWASSVPLEGVATRGADTATSPRGWTGTPTEVPRMDPAKRARIEELATLFQDPSTRQMAEEIIANEFGGMGRFSSLYSGM